MRAALAKGAHLAGHLAYEAGTPLNSPPSRVSPPSREAEKGGAGGGCERSEPAAPQPLLWFGTFPPPATVDAPQLLAPFNTPTHIGPALPGITQAQHAAAVARIQALIAAGDIYQANLTFQASVAVAGHPLALYARLREQARAPYAALVHTGEHWLLSLSPELFFRAENRRLTARPMKGTAPRSADPAQDRANATALHADPKNRAENLMITDLLRNDFSRVARDVAVPDLFALETYPSLHTMTSTITATLNPGQTALDALIALFPCGSVTGAPKIRAMQIIAETERHPRNAYCGSIGWLAPNGDAAFNVAIRTLQMKQGSTHATLGLGGGIVADSDAAQEWAECLTKARFLRPQRPNHLIETLRVENGIPQRLSRHLTRLTHSAARFAFPCDPHVLKGEIAKLLPHPAQRREGEATRASEREGASPYPPQRLRILLSASGHFTLHLSPAPPTPTEPVAVALTPLPVAPDDWRLAHKTSDRAFYDDARRAAGTFETLFVRPDGQLTEGSFTNLFVPRNGLLLTPPASAGLLPGILREELIATGQAVEHPLTAADLTQPFFIGNSLRGLLPAHLAPARPFGRASAVDATQQPA
ncbi:aminodeoxychorismate synthase component I [Sandaracinobacteroides saxicola]|uniref:Probable branched-chain-amino-acid aminotransferase n=2 Tax=Sandaracinobacteroides saxicola TaxID=2759707 RepID=A0A7G5IM74_9SPHN|nr:aminodeoxychorismate synthase component I [Sandaracinobacteroides saxicola]